MHAKQIRTKECRICGLIVNRRKRVVGRVGECPHCGALLYPFYTGRGKSRRTIWVTSSGKCKEVVDLVQEKIREAYELPKFEFECVEMELNFAKVLMDKCGGEYDVAAIVVEAFYDNEIRRQYGIWQKFPRSIKAIVWNQGCISIALAYALAHAPSQRKPKQQTARDLILDFAAG